MVRCSFGGVCVYETGLLLVCACRTSAASVEPLPRGSCAVAFPLWLQVLSCSTWLIVRCSLLHQLFLLCFGFIFGFILIGANTLMVIIRILSAELRPQVVEALLMLPKLRHLDNDLEIIIITYTV